MSEKFPGSFPDKPPDKPQNKENTGAGKKGMSRRQFLKTIGTAAGLAAEATLPRIPKVEGKNEKFDKFISEILPEIKPYYSGVDALLDNIYSSDSTRETPDFVHQRVQEIFSGELENIQGWNEALFEKGLRDHYCAYILQDFRNSQTAEKLAKYYKNLSPEERIAFEKKLRNQMPNSVTYEFLFRCGMHPLVFDPRDVPEYTTTEEYPEWNDGELFYSVTDSSGDFIARGVEESPSKNFEGNFNYIKKDGELVAFVCYYANWQPNFMFFDAQSRKKGEEGNFFKTYLGMKGRMFWYQIGNVGNVEEIKVTEHQVETLKKFFCWER